MKQPLTLTQEQTQQLLLSPQMRQSLEILQLDTLALREKILEALETNPMLELAPEDPEPALDGETWEWEASEKEEPFDIAREDVPEDPLARFSCTATSLQEMLWAQLAGLRLTPDRRRLLGYIVDSLDENGWLPESCQEISQGLGLATEEVIQGIQLIQRLEPAGVGGADLQDVYKRQPQFSPCHRYSRCSCVRRAGEQTYFAPSKSGLARLLLSKTE